MLSFEAVVGAVFLKCSVWLPWVHHPLPFPVRPLLSLMLSLPSPGLGPSAQLTCFPLQTTCLSFSSPDLCTCHPHPPGEPLLIAADARQDSLHSSSSHSMGLPGFPCHELGCILPHSSVCYVIWACAPVSWDGGGAFPHPWLPTCYLYTGGPLAGSPLYRIGSACDRAAGVLALEASREARFVPLGSDVCQTLTRGQDQLPMSPGLSVIYRCVTLRLKTTVISLSSQNLVA